MTDHRELGRSLNGLVWQLLARADRTDDDDARMVDAAHASQYHWREAGGPPGTRGEWLVSHVYAGDLDQAAAWHSRATAAGAAITDDEDREIFTADLTTGPWFDLPAGA